MFLQKQINAYLFCHYWKNGGRDELMRDKEKYDDDFHKALLKRDDEYGTNIAETVKKAIS